MLVNPCLPDVHRHSRCRPRRILSTTAALRRLGALCLLLPALAASGANDTPAPSPASIATQGTPQGAPACVTCHGAGGEGNAAAGFPRLAAIGATYLAEQLDAFAAGTRKNAVMEPIAKALTAPQREAMARYYAKLPTTVKLSAVPPDPRPQDKAAWLAERGRWSDGLPGCAQCHGPAGLGVGDAIPPLAGQPAAYLAAQLRGWKQGKRPPGPLALMVLIADKVADAEIEPLAAYYAGLPEAGKAQPQPSGEKPR